MPSSTSTTPGDGASWTSRCLSPRSGSIRSGRPRRGRRVTVDGLAFRVDGREVTSPLRGRVQRLELPRGDRGLPRGRRGGSAAIEGLASAGQVAGRMEPVEGGQDFLVVVDYAHTPDSIRTVLAAARPLATGRVIVVFGCGGDRDRAKRFPMGAAATEGADLTVISTDNPRSEDPLDIIADVERGAAEGGGRFVVEPDRRAAIRLALPRRDPVTSSWSPARVTRRSRSWPGLRAVRRPRRGPRGAPASGGAA